MPPNNVLTAVIDQQERIPFTFERLPTVTRKLRTGDYSLVGYEHLIGIERKKLDDLLGCIPDTPHQRQRFEREIMDLVSKPFHMLVVEATLSMIARKYEYCAFCKATGTVPTKEGGRRTCFKCGGHRVVPWRSRVHPNAVIGTLLTWQARYKLRIIYGGRHAECGRYVESSLEKAAAEFRKTLGVKL